MFSDALCIFRQGHIPDIQILCAPDHKKMESSVFFKWLVIVTILLITLILALSFLDPFEDILPISYASLAFFVILSIAVFYLGHAAAKSSDKNKLTQLIIALVFFKLFSCLLIIIVYDQIFQPKSNHYVIPFFLIYIVFTVFEVNMLTRAGRLSNH